MKNSLVLFGLLALVACEGVKGDKGDSIVGPQGSPGKDGGSCHVEDGVYGAVVVCDDGSSQDIRDGRDGQDGESIKGERGDQGIQGVKGDQGEVGPQGIPGVGCTVESFVGGAEIVCGGEAVVVSNGVNGNDGKDGVNATPVTILNPCPTVTTKYPELILKVGDQYLSYFKNGDQEFLTTLEKGVAYQTTDARKCRFSIPE